MHTVYLGHMADLKKILIHLECVGVELVLLVQHVRVCAGYMTHIVRD
jgi:hypothetical protein